MNTELAAAWDRHASHYERYFAPLTGFIAQSLFTLAAPRLAPDARVLDVACGVGAVTLPAVRRALQLGAGEVVASDFSAEMVHRTRRAAEALGDVSAVLRCEVQDGMALTYADASFDAVFSSFGIFLFPDRVAGWREAARVLRPGGTFATAVWQGPAHNEMLRAQMEPILRALPPHLLTPPKGGWMEVAEADALAAEVRAAGPFTDLQVLPFHATIALGDWTPLWDAMRDNPVMGALLARCTEAELAAVRAAFFAAFAERAGGERRPLVLHATCNLLLAARAS
ncbi:MAG: methyltransferase domain-containing protein [Polyangiales bacterium]